MDDEKPIREYDRFIVRLPDGMKQRISDRAWRNSRSMNSEVISLLEDALGPSDADARQAAERELYAVEKMKSAASRQLENLSSRADQLRYELSLLAKRGHDEANSS